MAQADSHLEIEHKFVLPDDFDRERFFSEVKRHQPLRCATAQVVERCNLAIKSIECRPS